MAKLRVLLASSIVAGLVAVAPPPPAGADAFLDPTFGTGGIVQQVLPAAPVPNGSVAAALVAPDGKVLILGRANASDPAPSPRGVVVRLTEAGALDPTFGDGGRAYLPDAFGRTDDATAQVRALARDGAGRIVVAGASTATAGGQRRTVVARLSPTGTLDPTFGTGGVVRLAQDGGAPRGVVADSQDRVVVVEDGPVPTVSRLTATGTLDAAFGTAGSVTLPAGDRPNVAPVDLTLLPGDGVAVVGNTYEIVFQPPAAYQHHAAAVLRLSSTGTITRVRFHRPGDDAPGGAPTMASAVAAVTRPDGSVALSLNSTAQRLTPEGATYDETSPWTGAFVAVDPPTDTAPQAVRLGSATGPTATASQVAVDAAGGVAVLINEGGYRQVTALTAGLTRDLGLGPNAQVAAPTFGDQNDVATDLAFDAQRRLVFAGIQRDQCCANWDFGAARLTTLDAPPSTPASAPRNVVVTVGSGRATVTWDAPASNGGLPITGYRLLLSDAAGNLLGTWGISPEERTALVAPLTNGHAYRVALQAVTVSHDGTSVIKQRVVPLPTSIAAFVDRTARDFTGTTLSTASRTSWIDQIRSQAKTPFDLVVALRRGPDATKVVDPTARLYRASFNRIPDAGGLTYWIGRKRSGQTLERMAATFAASSEFRGLYGPSLTPRAYVTQVYRNVLGREPDAAGVAYWADQVASGRRTRGQVMVLISESAENVRRQAPTVDVQVATLGLLGRAPTTTEQAEWTTALATTPYASVISTLMQRPEYSARLTA